MRQIIWTIVAFFVTIAALQHVSDYVTVSASQKESNSPAVHQQPQGFVSGTAESKQDVPAVITFVVAPPNVEPTPGRATDVRAKAGELFPLEVRVLNPDRQKLDAVAIHLTYDPSLLECVSSAGNLTDKAATVSSPFEVVLENRANHSLGQIDLAFGRGLTQAPLDTGMTVASIHFRARKTLVNAPVAFATRHSVALDDAAYLGSLVPVAKYGASITVDASVK